MIIMYFVYLYWKHNVVGIVNYIYLHNLNDIITNFCMVNLKILTHTYCESRNLNLILNLVFTFVCQNYFKKCLLFSSMFSI